MWGIVLCRSAGGGRCSGMVVGWSMSMVRSIGDVLVAVMSICMEVMRSGLVAIPPAWAGDV
jgi:hypothetical protein